MGGLFAGFTQLIQAIGPAIGGLVAGVLGTWAAITTVSTILRQVQHLGGIEGGTTGATELQDEDTTPGRDRRWHNEDEEEEEEDDDTEDIIEADDDDWYPKDGS